jgi:hypothetical protein
MSRKKNTKKDKNTKAKKNRVNSPVINSYRVSRHRMVREIVKELQDAIKRGHMCDTCEAIKGWDNMGNWYRITPDGCVWQFRDLENDIENSLCIKCKFPLCGKCKK